uniref:IgGFc_binding domain-containing protein n=1 Tax=Rhabditophanes sp. KR3021 TaxID=114890 RepID=A0AC35UFZ3_9BILA
MLLTHYKYNSFNNGSAKEFRIFVSCTEDVKLLSRVTEPFYGWSDTTMIPATSNAGTHYTFAIPAYKNNLKASVAILPVQQSGFISVQVKAYSNSFLILNETMVYDTTFNATQYYKTIWKENTNIGVTFVIASNATIMLSVLSPLSTFNHEGGNPGKHYEEDYVNFMPVSYPTTNCDSFTTRPDKRLIARTYTDNLHLSPSSCNAISTIQIYDDSKNIQGTDQVVSNVGLTSLDFNNRKQIGFSSQTGQMSTYRFGTWVSGDGLEDTIGHFAHYIPSTEEWVTSTTQFFTLLDHCWLEFYADQAGSNPDQIKIDGIPLSTLQYKKTVMTMFDHNYTQFITQIHNYGIHTIENDGNYVAYVIFQYVGTYSSMNGYLTGFNRRK